jgi:SNF2 family DNA or RNA helicase
MEVFISLDRVTIAAKGMELLKLKSAIWKRIGSLSSTTADSISFPLASLILVKDILETDPKVRDDIANSLSPFNSHEVARKKVLANLKSGSTAGVSSEWLDLLDPAQATAVSAMISDDILGICLFDEQGSGKTVMSIAAFDLLADAKKLDGAIVVCPKSMLNEWPKDFERFTNGKYKICVTGGGKKQTFDMATSNFDILVTNYEGVDIVLNTLIGSAKIHRYLLIVDESYYLKNSEAFRSRSVGMLRDNCERCFVLCGTPAPNSAHDLINQFDLADRGYAFSGFVKSSNPADDWENIADIAESRGLFIRRLKEEILDCVPQKNFHIIRVPLIGKQAMIYEQARSQLELELKTFTNRTFKKNLASYFQRRSALLQICTCPSEIDPMITEPPAKFHSLDKLLEQLITARRKVVLWSFYKRSIDEVMNRYKQYNPVRIDGAVHSTEKRREAVHAFQNDPNVMLFVGNPSAAGAGITLHASYDAIYLSYSNQAAHYLQSLDRIHRRGQISDQVNYYLLVCQNTIEESELVRLRNKEVRQHDLLGDHVVWPSSLDDALAELVINE